MERKTGFWSENGAQMERLEQKWSGELMTSHNYKTHSGRCGSTGKAR